MSTVNAQLITVARGNAFADLLLRNARIVNVFSGEIERGNIAISGRRIAGIGDYNQARRIVDLKGRYVVPGLIDGHVHLESAMLDAGEYARAVVPHGTLAAVTDLHEIANVTGLAGIRYFLNRARRLPLEIFLMAPSCVPATHLETAGAEISVAQVRRMLRWHSCLGLGEMMNFPGVLGSDSLVLAKLAAAGGKVVDGHAPGVLGHDLNAYIAAGIGSDHESVTLAEAVEKLRLGMYVMIREGSSEKNLEALLPLVTEQTYPRCCFVVDDRSCTDLQRDGDMDAVIRKAVRVGLEPVRAIQMATINPASYFKLTGLGAVAPGYWANLVVADDITDFRAALVFHRGTLVAERGLPLFTPAKIPSPQLGATVQIKRFNRDSFVLPVTGEFRQVIEVVPDQIITRQRKERVRSAGGLVIPDTSGDILKLVVVERHKMTGNIGIGLVKGFALQRGALASSVAHDAHNIIAVGTDDRDIYAAVREIERQQGGLVVVAGGKVLGCLPLPVAGLLSDRPMEEVSANLEELHRLAKSLGCRLPSPFATLSFLALPVIPELRLTDMGLVDVMRFALVQN